MGKKVLFFQAGPVATEEEAAELAALQNGQFDVFVRNAAASMSYGPRLEACDFVAGSVPGAYSESEVWDGSAVLSETQAIVEDDVAIEVPVTGTYVDTITPTVVEGVITGFVLS
jgi:hypothetical protein